MMHQEENLKIPDYTKCLESAEYQFCEICKTLHLYKMVIMLLDIRNNGYLFAYICQTTNITIKTINTEFYGEYDVDYNT